MDTFEFAMEELRHCPICGSMEIAVKHNKGYRLKGAPEPTPIIYFDCKTCTHQFLNPRPNKESYDKLYESGAYRQMIDGPAASGPTLINYAGEATRGSHIMSHLIPRMERQEIYANKIADIGGSTGMALYILAHEMNKANINKAVKTLNIEPDASFAAEGQKVGVMSVRSVKQAIQFAPFDLIISSHVIEHQNNALEFVKEITELGTTGTTYYFLLPLAETPAAYSLFHPHVFTGNSLRLLMEHAGLLTMDYKEVKYGGTLMDQYILLRRA